MQIGWGEFRRSITWHRLTLRGTALLDLAHLKTGVFAMFFVNVEAIVETFLVDLFVGDGALGE